MDDDLSPSERWEQAEAERDRVAHEMLMDELDEMCEVAHTYLEKVEEYEATHQYADPNSQLYFTYQGFDIPLKIHQSGKDAGYFMLWPGYDADPPGLYEAPTRGGGYEFNVHQPYGHLLVLIGREGYHSVENFILDYC